MMRFLSIATQPILTRFQFRLRSLFLGSTIVAVALAPVRAEITRCQTMQNLASHIQKQRGEIFFDYQLIEEGGVLSQLENDQPTWVRQIFGAYAFANVVEIHLDEKLIHAGVLEKISHSCPRLRHLSLSRTCSTNETARKLASCRSLRHLELDGNSKITDAGVSAIAGLSHLETLILDNTGVTGKSFAELAKLERLENLSLENAPVGDEHLADLAQSHSIKRLFLSGTEITDASIPQIARMKNLDLVGLSGTKVTLAGRALLQKLRPTLAQS